MACGGHEDDWKLDNPSQGYTKAWKDVLHTYDLQWGHLTQDSGVSSKQRRFLDLDWSGSLLLGLQQVSRERYPIPAVECCGWGLYATNAEQGETCPRRTNPGIFVSGITMNEINIYPSGVELDINIGIDVRADGSGLGLVPSQKEYTLLAIPLGEDGIDIPGLLTIGPNVQINGGVNLQSLSGAGEIKVPIVASIPDSSIITVNMLHLPPTIDKVSGWIPGFKLNPLETATEVNTTVELYLEVATALSILILGGCLIPYRKACHHQGT